MKKSFGVIGAKAECEDCDWKTESYKNAQAIAARHAKYHKHKVNIEVVNAGTYDGREGN